MNILEKFAEHTLSNPQRLAYVQGDRRYTYGQAWDEVTRLAGGLAALGVQRGDRVAVMLPSMPEFTWGTYACWVLGAAQVAINVMYKDRETAHLLGDSGAKAVITVPQFLPVVERVKPSLPELQHVIVIGGAPGALDYAAVVEKAQPVTTLADMAEDDLSVIAYTSGTTGMPKGAMLTHGSFLFQLQTYRDHFGLGPDDHSLTCLPLFLLSIHLLGPVCSHFIGSNAIVQARFEAAEYARLAKQYRPTWMGGGVPTMFVDLNQLPPEGTDLTSFRYCPMGGAPMPVPLRMEFESRFNCRLVYSYGGTETTAHMTADPLDRPNKPAAPGVPLPGHFVKIVDEDGSILGPNQHGEICSAGPIVMKGYWNLPEATARSLKDGWFHSGDIGYLDEDGFLYVVDRKVDVINRGGFKVFPIEIEKVLYEDPRVKECAVIGVPHERLGEVPKAYIVLHDGTQAAAEEFIQKTRQELANYKALSEVEFRSDLPKSPLMKVLRRELRREETEKRAQNQA